MSAMRHFVPRSVLLALVASALMLALAVAIRMAGDGGAGAPASPAPRGEEITIHPSWSFRPENLGQLTRRAQAAVVAEVTEVQAGPPLTGDSEFHPGEGVPTQRVQLRLVDGWYGNLPSEFALFRTGAENMAVEGDPAYRPGERYVLFVDPRVAGDGRREPGTFVAVAPDARLKVAGDRVEPVIDGPVGRGLRGRSLAAVKNETRAARKGD